jgi:hypothetical protein
MPIERPGGQLSAARLDQVKALLVSRTTGTAGLPRVRAADSSTRS